MFFAAIRTKRCFTTVSKPVLQSSDLVAKETTLGFEPPFNALGWSNFFFKGFLSITFHRASQLKIGSLATSDSFLTNSTKSKKYALLCAFDKVIYTFSDHLHCNLWGNLMNSDC